MEEEEKKESKISSGDAMMMIGVALLFDTVQGLVGMITIPLAATVVGIVATIFGFVLNTFISGFAWLTFYIWFRMKGMGFASFKRGGVLFGGLLVELIPGINNLPAWTVDVCILIFLQWLEEGSWLTTKVAGWVGYKAPELAPAGA